MCSIFTECLMTLCQTKLSIVSDYSAENWCFFLRYGRLRGFTRTNKRTHSTLSSVPYRYIQSSSQVSCLKEIVSRKEMISKMFLKILKIIHSFIEKHLKFLFKSFWMCQVIFSQSMKNYVSSEDILGV